MGKFRRVKPGDPILSGDFNAIAEALERFANLSVADGSYLRLWDGPDGKHLAWHPPVETLALLSGATSPYSFVEVDEDAAGAFVTRGVGDSGTANAYEINAKAGLSGRVVRLVWTGAGDWRFQWVGYGGVPCTGTTRICLNISSGCTSIATDGATVVVKDNTGATVGTCTASGYILSFTLTSGGSGYTNGTGYSLGLSGGGGTGLTGTFDVVGGSVTNLVVTNGGTGYMTPPTITFPGAGGGSGAIASANLMAKCCVSIANSGTYTVTTTVPGATPITSTVPATCDIDNFASTMAFPVNSLGLLCVQVLHCGYANGGDTAVIKKSGTTVATVTTDSNGRACAVVAAGSGYTVEITAAQGATKTISSFSVAGCATTTVGGTTLVKRCYSVITSAPGCTVNITVKYPLGVTLGTVSVTTSFDGTFYSGTGCITIAEMFDPGSVTIEEIAVCPAGTFDSFPTVVSICALPGSPVFYDLRGICC